MHNKQRFINVTSWVIILVSVASIAGWILNVEILKSLVPGLPSMKMNTAVCLLLCGMVALFFVADAEKHFNIIIPLNFIALVLSALTLFEYLFNENLRIDEFLVEEKDANLAPGRMALTSATCLFLLTAGFAFVTAQAPRVLGMVARVFFIIVALVAILAIVGYIINEPDLHNLSTPKSMALLTAVLLLPLALVYLALLTVAEQVGTKQRG